MKNVEVIDLIAKGQFPNSNDWKHACRDVKRAILQCDWPHGSGKFTILPKMHGNGVVAIKLPLIKHLKAAHWEVEDKPEIPNGVLTTGDLDAIFEGTSGYIGFEWETGNISSSHRAINKLLLSLQMGGIKGGILVVPGDRLYPYLTDRIGNIRELRPYFPLWKSVQIADGALRIYVVEQDKISDTVEHIPKGTDGRALR